MRKTLIHPGLYRVEIDNTAYHVRRNDELPKNDEFRWTVHPVDDPSDSGVISSGYTLREVLDLIQQYSHTWEQQMSEQSNPPAITVDRFAQISEEFELEPGDRIWVIAQPQSGLSESAAEIKSDALRLTVVRKPIYSGSQTQEKESTLTLINLKPGTGQIEGKIRGRIKGRKPRPNSTIPHLTVELRKGSIAWTDNDKAKYEVIDWQWL